MRAFTDNFLCAFSARCTTFICYSYAYFRVGSGWFLCSGELRYKTMIQDNSRQDNFVKREYTRKLLSQCDVLFLQEHLLADSQLFELGSINKNFLYHGVCGFDSTEVLSGRPYGGCAILWRADWSARAEIVDSGSRRMCVVRLCTNNWKVLLINVYMPYEDNDERTDEFCELLSKI